MRVFDVIRTPSVVVTCAGERWIPSEHENDAGYQQQNQHDRAESGLIKMAVEAKPEPRAGKQHRQADQEHPNCVRGEGAANTEPRSAHRKDRDAGRLEHGSLLILWPSP